MCLYSYVLAILCSDGTPYPPTRRLTLQDMEAPVPLTLLGYYDDLGPEYVHDNCLFASPSLRRIAYYKYVRLC